MTVTTTRPIIRIFSVLAMTGVLTVLLAACGKSAAPVPTMAPPNTFGSRLISCAVRMMPTVSDG